MGKKEKRAWDDPERVAERAQRDAEEQRENDAKKARVQQVVATWGDQRQPFQSDFLGSYACSDRKAAELARETLGIVVQSDPSCVGFTPAPMQRWSDNPLLLVRRCQFRNCFM